MGCMIRAKLEVNTARLKKLAQLAELVLLAEVSTASRVNKARGAQIHWGSLFGKRSIDHVCLHRLLQSGLLLFRFPPLVSRLVRFALGSQLVLFHDSLKVLSKDEFKPWNELCRKRIKDAHERSAADDVISHDINGCSIVMISVLVINLVVTRGINTLELDVDVVCDLKVAKKDKVLRAISINPSIPALTAKHYCVRATKGTRARSIENCFENINAGYEKLALSTIINAQDDLIGQVSASKEYHVNSLAVPRKAKEANGGITNLTHTYEFGSASWGYRQELEGNKTLLLMVLLGKTFGREWNLRAVYTNKLDKAKAALCNKIGNQGELNGFLQGIKLDEAMAKSGVNGDNGKSTQTSYEALKEIMNWDGFCMHRTKGLMF
ncbi:hypothetical protein Tco_0311414 [Tanacetum coccineum]